jgi:thiamine pyrophosphate-dependent acetolactate synthase large subunit-like protein
MTLDEASAPVAQYRGDRVVIPTMSAVGAWPKHADGPLDFHYLPSSMGQAIPLGLGLALAKPGRGVVVLSGDGGLLMNLGCLVTLACHSVPVAVVLLDNGLYEVTGGQPIAGAGRTDFAGLAMAAGIGHVATFDSASGWESGGKALLTAPSPSFAWLKIEGRIGMATPKAPRPMAEQIARLRTSLGND